MSLGDYVQGGSTTGAGYPIITSPTTPLQPTEGTPWLNSTTNVLSVYTNGAWVQPASTGGALPTANAQGDMIIADATQNWSATNSIFLGNF